MAHKGFVDLQVNGYLGADFSSPTLEPDDIHCVTEALIAAGTVGYCATMITSPPEVYARNLPLLASAMVTPGVRGHLLGIHLEGPFLSPEEGARGAHQACWMRRPDREYFGELQERAQGEIKLLTLAPELDGAIDLIEYVRENFDTSVSLGHHLAGGEIIRDAVTAGAALITHLGNGCPNLIHRHRNPIFHQLAHEGLCAGLITDGEHIPDDFIRIVFKCKGVDRVFVVSDSAPIAGLSPGTYTNMGIQVRMTPSGRIEQVDAPYLAGSGSTMAQCMRFLRSRQFLGENELWQVGYENPLKILGRSESCLSLTHLPDFHW